MQLFPRIPASGRALVPAAVVAVAVASVLTTLAMTWAPRAEEHPGRPAAPLETPVVKAPALAPDTAVLGGPPAEALSPARAEAPASRNSRP